MKKDIRDGEDVKFLVNSFYEKVFKDEKIGHFFSHIIENNPQSHLELLYSFWNNVLFFSGGYYDNPLRKHARLHAFKKLSTEDFTRCLQLFDQTVDELFVGEKAELAKQRAHSIATVMQVKILHSQTSNSPI